ncbi:chromate efflux transporter [Rhodovulum sp. DZ06]|uniref:chromate efflux transporter n=1 Tax=Rhodovulum sp. DZ06 TaxID=3425126 RepID=UPI003D341ADB
MDGAGTGGAGTDSAGTGGTGTGREGFVAIFLAFLRLGLTAFGGPVAHIGFFREEFVARRGWLSEARYAELVALCQVLPGPASSQVGFALGLMRGGWRGAAAAFLGFTLPSALALALFGAAVAGAADPGAGWLVGLKAAAAGAVAAALWGMAQGLAPDRARRTLALAAACVAALAPGVWGQLGAVALGAAAGLALRQGAAAGGDGRLLPVSRAAGTAALAGFAALLLGLPLLAGLGEGWALADGIARAGALVFGGGHVVLPLLQAEVVETGLVPAETFLAGYGAAQAVPGPLFTIASHLGAAVSGASGAVIATLAIFAPGFLLLVGAAPFWEGIRTRAPARHALAGINAAVVGLLLAAFWDPVLVTAGATPAGFALALASGAAMGMWKLPPALVVLGAAALGQGAALAGLL